MNPAVKAVVQVAGFTERLKSGPSLSLQWMEVGPFSFSAEAQIGNRTFRVPRCL